MDAELTGFVAGRGDDAPATWLAANSQGQPPIFRMNKEMDVDEEGVHIQVEYGLRPDHLWFRKLKWQIGIFVFDRHLVQV